MKAAWCVALVLGCGDGWAQELGKSRSSAELTACMDKADNQLAMRLCADEEARRADASMEAVYAQLLQKSSTAVKTRLEAAQRAWVSYRDFTVETYCDAKEISRECGSLYFTESLLVRARLTRDRADELNALLKTYEPR